MAVVYQDQQGQPFVNYGGRWQRVDAETAEVMKGSGREAGLKMAMQSLLAVNDIVVQSPANLFWGNRTGAGEEVESMASRVQSVVDESVRSPLASEGITGALIGADITGLSGVGRIYGTRALRGAASRVSPNSVASRQAVSQGAADSAAAVPGRHSTSVGAAQTGRQAPKRAGQKFFEAINSRLGEPRVISPDQYEILRASLDRAVGFEMPPGWQLGEELFADINSNPILKQALAPYLDANGRTMGNKFLDAIPGLRAETGGQVGRGMRTGADRVFRQRYGLIEDAMEGTTDLSEWAETMSPWLRPELRRKMNAQGWVADGPDMMRARSQINAKAARVASRPTADDPEDLFAFVDEVLDEEVKGRLSPEMLDYWADTREMYRTAIVLDKPGVVDLATGELSLKSLARQLEKQYGDFADMSPGELAKIQTRLPETAELLKFVRVARSFEDGLPNSGTATRSALTEWAKNPVAAYRLNAFRAELENFGTDPRQWIDAGLVTVQ